jgi:hypothetical protein
LEIVEDWKPNKSLKSIVAELRESSYKALVEFVSEGNECGEQMERVRGGGVGFKKRKMF